MSLIREGRFSIGDVTRFFIDHLIMNSFSCVERATHALYTTTNLNTIQEKCPNDKNGSKLYPIYHSKNIGVYGYESYRALLQNLRFNNNPITPSRHLTLSHPSLLPFLNWRILHLLLLHDLDFRRLDRRGSRGRGLGGRQGRRSSSSAKMLATLNRRAILCLCDRCNNQWRKIRS